MRLAIATTLLLAVLLLAIGPPVLASDVRADEGSDDDPGASLLAEVIRRTEFDELSADLGTGTLPLAASPGAGGASSLRPMGSASPREREALLLLLLRTSEDPNERRDLARALFARLDELSDWSLLALLFEEGLRTGAGSLDDALDAAARVLAALEEPSPRRAGYERLAIAVAGHARGTGARLERVDGRRGAPARRNAPGDRAPESIGGGGRGRPHIGPCAARSARRKPVVAAVGQIDAATDRR